MITDDELRDTVLAAAPDMELAVKNLVAKANAAGGEDNITVVVIGVTDEPAAAESKASDSNGANGA
jgi:serine/threonine protein phosphatase PrpC